jgi:hypothetical protein
MPISLGKVVPRVIVVAALGYNAWPSITFLTNPPPAKQTTKPTEMSKSLLSPAQIPAPKRNPFLTQEEQIAMDASEDTAKEGNQAKFKHSGQGRNASEDEEDSEQKTQKVVLNATYITNNSRLAIINGHVYKTRESSVASQDTPGFTVLEIYPDRVLLESDGKSLELTYPDKAAGRAAAEGNTARGKSSGGGKSLLSGSRKKPKDA